LISRVIIGGVFNPVPKQHREWDIDAVGRASAPQLQVTNTATGIGAVGVGINVSSGEPPLAFNSSTQVANLNASLGRPIVIVISL
jgi:hypothetical protein